MHEAHTYSSFHLDIGHMQRASARPQRETEVNALHLIGNRSRSYSVESYGS
jgi:hypothetical protein